NTLPILKGITMDKRIKGLVVACFSLGVSLLATGPAWSVAASEATPLSSATLDELDEIVLHGKRMEQRMLESQERFYQLYNKLNANDDFDVSCKFVYVDPDATGYGASRTKQGCAPMFFVNAVAEDPQSYPSGSCSYSSTFSDIRTGNNWFNDPTGAQGSWS